MVVELAAFSTSFTTTLTGTDSLSVAVKQTHFRNNTRLELGPTRAVFLGPLFLECVFLPTSDAFTAPEATPTADDCTLTSPVTVLTTALLWSPRFPPNKCLETIKPHGDDGWQVDCAYLAQGQNTGQC
ncbi:hypothetical protein GWK47_033713 [Chionoecetes opilio]|uniref:Uncharacterized protein n=1 Tax=Chionoecetes opilio TaxID=41210 RepID=A0A8J5D392_CHIOP|nr:hypothetical protein GWK47_033713 [Chionoecetes opilio]